MAKKDFKRVKLEQEFAALKEEIKFVNSRSSLITILERATSLFSEASGQGLTLLIEEFLAAAEKKVKNYEMEIVEDRQRVDKAKAEEQQRLEEALEKAKLEALGVESARLQEQHETFKQDTNNCIIDSKHKREQLVAELQNMKNSGKSDPSRLNVIGKELGEIEQKLEEQKKLGKQHKNNIAKHHQKLAAYHQELTASQAVMQQDTKTVRKQDDKTVETEYPEIHRQKEAGKREIYSRTEDTKKHDHETDAVICEISEEVTRIQEVMKLCKELTNSPKLIDENKSQEPFSFVTLLKNSEQPIQDNKVAENINPKFREQTEELKDPHPFKASKDPSVHIANIMRNTLGSDKGPDKNAQLSTPGNKIVSSSTPIKKANNYPEGKSR